MMSCSANDEDSGAFFSHWWQAVHVLNEDVLVLPLSWTVQGLRLAQIAPQLIQSHMQILKKMKHAHTKHNDQKASYGAHNIHGWHGAPLFEEDDGGGEHHSGEKHIVDRVDKQCVKGVQRLVQVVDLDDDGSHQSQQEYPGKRIAEDRGLDENCAEKDAQAFHWRHGEGSEQRANAYVD